MVDDSLVHYHHIAGMGGGYLPDAHGVYDSFEGALASVRDDISRDTEDGADGDVRVFTDHSVKPYEGVALIVGYYPVDVSPHDLGWYYEIFPAFDDAPDHEDCRAILNGEKEAPLW